MEAPATRYALSSGASIAYQQFGEGDLNVLVVSGPGSHLELQWEHPLSARFLRRLGGLGRIIMFDRRGMGLSDPCEEMPTYEQQVEDALAVLDTVGCERVAVIGISEAARMTCVLAAMRPERVSSLVLVSPGGRPAETDRPEVMAALFDRIEHAWGTGATLQVWGPHLTADQDFVSWWGRWERGSASPGIARRFAELAFRADVTAISGAVQAPTLVVHRTGDPGVTDQQCRDIAALISQSSFLSVEGLGAYPFMSDPGPLLEAVGEFLTGHRNSKALTDTVLASVLFTDIVGSTSLAEKLGDDAWEDLLDTHEAIMRRQVDTHDGRIVKDLGDGFMVAFDGPARALRCARSCVDAALSAGLTIRAGVHTGECVRRGQDLGGIAVHVAARVSALANGGEVLCSSTVKDLVLGSGLNFTARGQHELRGINGKWPLFALTGDGGSPP